MRRDVLRGLCAGLLGLCACSWSYGSGGDFTDAERALFVDAPRMFPIKMLGNYDPSNPAWFDEKRLIFSTGKTADGWRTRPKGSKDAPEPPKIVLLNVRTGTLEVTQYRGILQCYADGNLVLTAHPDAQPDNGDSTPRPHRQGSKYWYGRFGEKLQRMPDAAGIPSFSPVSCLPIWFESATGERLEQGERRGKDIRYTYTALRAADGVFKETSAKYAGKDISPFTYADSQGVSHPVSTSVDLWPNAIRYMPYLKQYEIWAYHARYLLSKDGKLKPSPKPPVPIIGNTQTDFARDGTIWAHGSVAEQWQRQGIYFERGGKVYRLDDHYIVASAGISTDGCHYAYSRSEGNPWRELSSTNPLNHPDIVELVTINLCRKRNEQRWRMAPGQT